MAKLHLPEDSFNRVLAKLLRTARPEWSKDGIVLAETWRQYGTRRVKPDIYIDDRLCPPIIVECAYGGDQDADAIERLTKTPIETVIAVDIPQWFKFLTENEAESAMKTGECVRFAVLQQEHKSTPMMYRFPNRGYISGTYQDLAILIHLAAIPKSKVESIATQIAELVEECGSILGEGINQRDWMYVAKHVYQYSALTAQRTIAVMWLDAMLVHSYLRRKGTELPPLPLKQNLSVSVLLDSWRSALSLNWRSIFAPASEILELSMMYARGSTFDALCCLLDAVEIIETARLGRHINIGADLFPKISEDREVAAAFYTTPATSELLASLLVRITDREDWSRTDLASHIKFADFACGTGSLVRAVYRRIFDMVSQTQGAIESFHTDSMEQVITAADISPIAAHLTNSSLAMMGDGLAYAKTNIGWVSVGFPFADGVGLSTGSLEFLQSSSLKDLFFDVSQSLTGTDKQPNKFDSNVLAVDGTFDYVVMNPPYSRSSGGKHGAFELTGLTTPAPELCRKRWGYLIANEPADKKAGMAASFLVLAMKKVKTGGRIGFVLPLTIAFGSSWRKTREMLTTYFEEILIVANAIDGGTLESLSADTNMGEILFIATKRDKAKSPTPIAYVSLRRPVTRLLESREVARVIHSSSKQQAQQETRLWLGEDMIGSRFSFLPKSADDEWSAVGVLNTTLLEHMFHFIKSGELLDEHGRVVAKLKCNISSIGEVFRLGQSSSSIGCLRKSRSPRGAFSFEEIQRGSDKVGRYRAVWSANKDTQKRLTIEPTHYGTPRESEEKVEQIMATASTLHYAQELRMTSQALVVARTDKSVLGGSSWQSLRDHSDRDCRSVFSLWANSTLGSIIHWTKGTRTQNGRSRTSINTIRTLPCPNFHVLDQERLRRADMEFEQLSQKNLLPVCQAHIDPVRQEIDRVLLDILDLPMTSTLESIAMLRDWWCAEPSVHGNNATALAKLEERELL